MKTLSLTVSLIALFLGIANFSHAASVGYGFSHGSSATVETSVKHGTTNIKGSSSNRVVDRSTGIGSRSTSEWNSRLTENGSGTSNSSSVSNSAYVTGGSVVDGFRASHGVSSNTYDYDVVENGTRTNYDLSWTNTGNSEETKVINNNNKYTGQKTGDSASLNFEHFSE